MKRKLSLLLALMMMVTLFAGCNKALQNPDENMNNNNDNKEQGQTSDGKDTNQYLNVYLSAEPSVLDVARFVGVVDRNMFFNVLEPLTRIENGEVVGAGAESWDISDDGLTYTFHLRENYWTDGQKVTAQDYITALQRQCDPNNAFPHVSDYNTIENFVAISSGEADVSTLGASAPDENTLVLKLNAPNVALLSSTDFFPDRADIAEKYGDTLGTEASNMMCCGPYTLESWTHNSQLVLTKNDKYWDADSFDIQKVTMLIIPDSNAQMASLENGSLDYLGVSTPEYVEKFQARDDMDEMMLSSARTSMVIFNCEDSVFSNEKVRQAFSLALDRDALAEVISNGTATPAYSLVPPDCQVGNLNFRENVEEPLTALAKEVDDPKALLIEGMQELGLGDDPSKLTVKFAWGATTAEARTYSELYQQLWQEALGCTVELEFNDSATHQSNVNAGNFQMASMSWGANYEPQFQLSRWSTEVGGQSRWKNADYVSLVTEASQTEDEQKRLELYGQAEELLIREAAIAPIYFQASRRFYYTYVNGLNGNTFDTTSFKGVYTSGR